MELSPFLVLAFFALAALFERLRGGRHAVTMSPVREELEERKRRAYLRAYNEMWSR